MIGTQTAPILLITGVLTLAPAVMVIDPRPPLRLVFGEDSADGAMLGLARHWGLLVALVGALLIYAAFDEALRPAVMTAAIVEKLAGGVIFGTAAPHRPALVAIILADSAMALLYLLILGGL